MGRKGHLRLCVALERGAAERLVWGRAQTAPAPSRLRGRVCALGRQVEKLGAIKAIRMQRKATSSARPYGKEKSEKATAGFEPANGGFADLCLSPLGYVARKRTRIGRQLSLIRSYRPSMLSKLCGEST